MTRLRNQPLWTLAAVLLLTSVSTVLACTVPVFRYALDRWQADPFALVIPQSLAEDQATNDLLRPIRANSPANLEIVISPDPSITQTGLFFPSGQRPAWLGDLTEDALAMLMDSPARKQLREKILSGASTIWILVDDGDEAGAAEEKRIRSRLAFLEQAATLPIQDPNDPDSQLGPGPELKLDFDLIRVRRDDPAETAFIEMLRGPTPDPATAEEPFIAAAFGRGRSLGAWLAKDMDNIALEDASMFMVGRCSCQVKQQNPGWDLLMKVDWDRALQKVALERESEPETNPAAIEDAGTPSPQPVAKEDAPPPPSTEIIEVVTQPSSFVEEIPLPKASPARIALFSFAGFCALVVLLKLLASFSSRPPDDPDQRHK